MCKDEEKTREEKDTEKVSVIKHMTQQSIVTENKEP